MRRNLLNLIVLFTGTAVFVSCGGADKHAIAVPKDAAVVFHINAPSLSSKLSWDEIKATNWFKELQEKADNDDTLARQLLDNPGSSGINTEQDLVFFVKRRGRGAYGAFEGTLKDASAFETFIKKVNKQGTPGKDGDMNIWRENDNVVTWNSNRFIFLFNAPGAAQIGPMDNSSYDNSGADNYGKYPADSLVKFSKELYSLSGDQSLFNDKRFADLIKEPGDMHFWLNAEYMGTGGMGEALSMLKLSTLTEGAVTAVSINFDNGKIAMKGKSYYNKELGKIYEKYKMKNFDAAVLNRIPSQNIVGLMSFNYPPEGLREFMKVIGVDGFVNSFMSEINYSMDEFVKANKGEVLLALTDLEVKQVPIVLPEGMERMEGIPHSRSVPDFKVLFATSINDKAAFEKLVSVLKTKIGEMPEGKIPPISYSMNDNWFAASNNQETVNQFLAGGNNNWPIVSKISGHPMIFYVDLQKCMKPFAGDDSASNSLNPAFVESLKMWENIIGTGGEIVDGAMQTSFEVNLVDKNTNALKQLNQYADKMAAGRKKPF
jgi:hypothetical protein